MQDHATATSTAGYLSFYDLSLSVDTWERPMGRITHLQIFDLEGESHPEGMSHAVRFCNTGVHCELTGRVRSEGNGSCFTLDMGEGKVYRFTKLVLNTPDATQKQG